jgi:hypothetical protein
MTRMKILFLFDDLCADPRGGGFSLASSRLALLRCHADVQRVWLHQDTLPDANGVFQRPPWPPNEAHAAADVIQLTWDPNHRTRFQGWRTAVADPARWLYPDVLTPGVVSRLADLIHRERPDLVWAEHLLPATAVVRLGVDVPIVYGHHDWRWRIKRLRAKGTASLPRILWSTLASRRHELATIRKVTTCVSASRREATEIRRYGGVGHYFPLVSIPLSEERLVPPRPSPKVVHLGSMSTTASREGLSRFMDVVWPRLQGRPGLTPELEIVGNLDGAPDRLRKQLHEAGAKLLGFVPDLGSVMRPWDIHIVPWEHDTGTRTRIPVALNYMQALVATGAGAGSIGSLTSGTDCILVERLTDMVPAIESLIRDDELRRSLARAGRATFLREMTIDSVSRPFGEFLDSAAAGRFRPGR